MPFPWANTILLALLLAQLLTGFVGLISGAMDRSWALWLHGVGAYGIAVILFWKARVVLNSLEHRRRAAYARAVFLVMAGMLLLTLGTGLLWSFAGRRYVGGFSLITIHIVLAVAVGTLLVYHVATMRFVLRIPDAVGRRAFLRLGSVAVAGLILSQLAAGGMALLRLPGARRRFTGSYETGSLTGELPVVIWLSDLVPALSADTYRLTIEGLVDRPFTLTHAGLVRASRDRQTVILDCTGGWYSEQEWTGVRVGRLLERAGVQAGARSVLFQSATGYWRRYPVEEARNCLLAMAVGGSALDAGHGYPARLVAERRRGFEWVKWVVLIRADAEPPLAQPPLPLQ